MRMIVKAGFPGLVAAFCFGTGFGATAVDFAREVLPVLSDKCYACHGPDTQNEKDLRLDSFGEATRDLGGYRAIDPDNPAESEVIARIYDKDDPMPPEDADKQLTESERELIRTWVMSGGQYAEHWSFVKPQKPAPDLDTTRDVNAIDAFVSHRLAEKGAGFAPRAEKSVLARRASLVLTGLPPEPSLVDEFIHDDSSGAYGKLVDRLIADPKFGEHQARYWLDAVRYGDTHGLHLDNRRGIYPYRDWVVRSINDNLPVDTSIEWQLAGDLLPDPGREQLLATGFVRMNPTTSEGGAIPEEFQAKNNFDRTETFGTVFLGMTLNCARCHNHKYDPISQKEYYKLLAFFNSTAEHSMDGNSYTYGPTVRVPENQMAWNRWDRLETRRDRVLGNIFSDQQPDWESVKEYAGQQKLPEFSDWMISSSVPVSVADTESIEWKELKGFPGRRGEVLPDQGEAVWVSFKANTDRSQTLWVEFSTGVDSRVLVDGREIRHTAPHLVDHRATVLPLVIEPGTSRIQVQMTGNGLQTNLELRFIDPWKELAEAGDWHKLDADSRMLLAADSTGPLWKYGEVISAVELATDIQTNKANFTTSLIAKERDTPRETRVLQRGEYNLPMGDPLEPDVLQVMGGLPADAPRNRLGLARWLTSPEHPLVTRVLVNQLWLRVFGEGLVRTPEDFGRQGQQPTHPKLLDWLAVEFQDSGWDLKHMLKLMVMSRTFQQDSERRTDIMDPENRLWSRGPSYRLDAEVLRDTALWASGALDWHMGGEGIKPYQPGGMWLAMAHPASNTKQYIRDKNWRLYRRSLYVYWKRTSPHPMMTLFDAPSRESSCIRRSRTNTPLQSLGLLNETQRVELGRVFAERVMREGRSDQDRMDMMFRLLTSRTPNEREREVCNNLLESMRSRYEGDADAAHQLVAVGDFPRPAGLNPVEQAAWTQLVLTVMASDLSILLY